MNDIWQRSHSWLDVNAPPGYGKLRPAASTGEILAAEKSLGIRIPSDFADSIRVHDGQANEPGLIGGEGWMLTSLQQIEDSWRRWFQPDPKFAQRIPIAWNAMSDYVFINLDGTESLKIQRRDRVEDDPLAPSFRAWLEDFAVQLENGEFAYSQADGELMYADELDLD